MSKCGSLRGALCHSISLFHSPFKSLYLCCSLSWRFIWFPLIWMQSIYILSGNSLALLLTVTRGHLAAPIDFRYIIALAIESWRDTESADGAVDRRSLCHRCCKPQSGDNGNATINHCLLRKGKWEQTYSKAPSDGPSSGWHCTSEHTLRNTRQDVFKMIEWKARCFLVTFLCFAPTCNHHRGHSLAEVQIWW